MTVLMLVVELEQSLVQEVELESFTPLIINTTKVVLELVHTIRVDPELMTQTRVKILKKYKA